MSNEDKKTNEIASPASAALKFLKDVRKQREAKSNGWEIPKSPNSNSNSQDFKKEKSKHSKLTVTYMQSHYRRRYSFQLGDIRSSNTEKVLIYNAAKTTKGSSNRHHRWSDIPRMPKERNLLPLIADRSHGATWESGGGERKKILYAFIPQRNILLIRNTFSYALVIIVVVHLLVWFETGTHSVIQARLGLTM